MQKIKFIILISIFLLNCVSFGENSENDYQAQVQRVRTLRTRIQAKERSISEIVEQKKKIKDSEQMDTQLKLITSEYKDLKKLYQDFEEEYRTLRFRYPEKSNKEERKYHSVQAKSMEELSTASGLDGQMNNLKFKIKAKYKTEDKQQKQKEQRTPASETTSESNLPIKLSK